MEPETTLQWNEFSDIFYNKETNIFSLEIKAKGNQSIEFTLLDKACGIVYERKYADEQIPEKLGNGFEDNMDVMMIFTPLDEVKYKLSMSDSEKVKAYSKPVQIERYTYGQPIINENASYQIHKDGLIKIKYQKQKKGGIKKKKAYTAEIILHKMREMTEKDLYYLQLKELRIEFDNKFANQAKENQQIIQIVKNENQILKNGLEKRVKFLQKLLPNHFRHLYTIEYPRFTFIHNNFTQMTIHERIPFNDLATYKIKIIKCAGKNIMFGVTNVKQSHSHQVPYTTEHAIVYYGLNSNVFTSNHAVKTEGNGYGLPGDVVQIRVELNIGKITWVVNDVEQVTYIWENLKNPEHRYSPYFQLHNIDDCIEWID